MADIGGDGASLMMGGFDPSAFTGEFSPRRVTLWTCSLVMPWCSCLCFGTRVVALLLLCCFASQCLVGSFASHCCCCAPSSPRRCVRVHHVDPQQPAVGCRMLLFPVPSSFSECTRVAVAGGSVAFTIALRFACVYPHEPLYYVQQQQCTNVKIKIKIEIRTDTAAAVAARKAAQF